MSRTQIRNWVVVGALCVANPLLHKPVSDVCDLARAAWGFAVYDRVALIVIPLASLVVAGGLLALRRMTWLRREVVVAALALAAVSIAAQRSLLVANIELVHFPQYAVMSGGLLAAGLSGPAAYLGATAAGIADEAYQHLVVYAGRPDTYFDVNDIVLNAVGAAWGILLLGDLFDRRTASLDAARRTTRHNTRTLQRGAAVAVASLVPAVWLDPPQFLPLLRHISGGHSAYRVLSLGEGLVVVAVLWTLVVWAAAVVQSKIKGARESHPATTLVVR